MAQSQPGDRRYAGLVVFLVPAAAAAAHALLAWNRPELVPLVQSWRPPQGLAAAVGAATIIVLWLLLAVAPLLARAGWRQALGLTAPALLPFVLLFALLAPGVEQRVGSGLAALLVGVAWALWLLSALAVLFWARSGRLPEAERGPAPARPDAWAGTRAAADTLLPFVLVAAAAAVRLLELPLGLGALEQRTLAYAAERVAEGQVLYRDVFAPLPPGPVYLAAGLFRVMQPGMILVKAPQVGYAALMAAAGYGVARRFATPLFAFVAALLVGCAVPPSPALALVLLGYLCAFRLAWSRETAWGLAGLLTGVAILFDPLVGAAAAASLAAVLVARQMGWVRARMRAPGVDMGLSWAAAFRYLLTALVPLALAAGYFAWAKALPDLWRGAVVARYGLAGLRLPPAEAVHLEAATWQAVMAAASSAGPLLIPGILLLGLLRLGYGLAARTWGEGDTILLGLVILGALLVAVGAGAWAELAAVPALLVAAHVLAWGWQGVGRVLGGERRRLAMLRLDGYALAGVAVIVLGVGMMAPSVGHISDLTRGASGEGYRPVKGVLRASGIRMTDPEASALEETLEVVSRRSQLLRPILCLPDCPEIYFLADRDAPSRFIVAGGWTTPSDDAELADALAEADPAVVVLPGGQESGKRKWPETRTRIWARYRPDGRFGRYEVWLPPAAQP